MGCRWQLDRKVQDLLAAQQEGDRVSAEALEIKKSFAGLEEQFKQLETEKTTLFATMEHLIAEVGMVTR